MRVSLAIGLGALLHAVPSAFADTPGTGSCMGTAGFTLAGTVGISAPDSNGTLQSVQAGFVPTIFGQAECACASSDLRLEIFLTQALPSGTLGTAEVWAGAGCDNYNARTQIGQTVCEKLATVDINQFNLGGTSTANRIEIPLNGAAVNSPITHACNQAAASNSLWVFLYSNPQMPFATCSLNMTEQNQGPGAPTSTSASSGDSAVTVSWSPPPSTETQPYYFQVLCARADGSPIPGKSDAQQYSTCLPGGQLRRRALPTASPAQT